MDNEAPNYAKWIPEAGGYVANGKVVSKSPVYEEDGSGKMKLNVDTSLFPTQQQQSPSPNMQSANNPITNNGITTANKAGSGEDANSLATGIGSMGSLNNNTATNGGVLTSPAMTGPNTNLTPSQISGKTTDDLMAEFAQFQAENNYQGMINTLTQMSAMDGVDRSAMINDLQRARGEKIRSQDDQYLQAINQARQEATQTGDYTKYNQLVAEQQSYRDAVGYQDAMQRQYNMEMEDLQLDYESTWTQSINDMTNAIMQSLQGIINFQYDPSQDQNLLRAQAHTELMMRNAMAATGMYYSNATQYAITQAVAELVPVYQKMAKEEAIENFKLLQSTASYLMNLEEQQFDMWRSQIELQFEANNEKRKQVQAAIEKSNARGYVNNEEAAILGVPAGTESYEQRQRMQDKQDQIDKELRALEQDKELAKFKSALALEEYERELLIQKKYNIGNFKPEEGGGGDGSEGTTKYQGMTATQFRDALVAKMNNNELDEQGMRDAVNKSTFSDEWKSAIISEVINKTTANSGEIDFSKPLTGNESQTALTKTILEYEEKGLAGEENLINVFDDLLANGKDYNNVYNAIIGAKVDLGDGTKDNVFNTRLLLKMPGKTKQEKLENYYKYYAAVYASVGDDGKVDVGKLHNMIFDDEELSKDLKQTFTKEVVYTYGR